MMAVTGARTLEGGFHANLFMFIMTLMLVFIGPGQFSLQSCCCKGGRSKQQTE
jgi:uncharacterized membrane protein YphA (DoxX/SURF4 family)